MTTATPVLLPGDKATHMGHDAVIVHGYDEADPWLPPAGDRRPPVVNIRLDPPVRGMSPQMDVPVSALTRKGALPMSHIVIKVYNFACDYPGCDVTNIEVMPIPTTLREARKLLRQGERWTVRDGKDYCPKHASEA